jgi:hypothetical protein
MCHNLNISHIFSLINKFNALNSCMQMLFLHMIITLDCRVFPIIIGDHQCYVIDKNN